MAHSCPALRLRGGPLAVLLAIAGSAAAAADPMRELELRYLRAALASDLLPVAHLEVPGLDHLRLGERSGRACLGLRTYLGQPVKNGGVRAELSIDPPCRPGDTLTYRWSLLLPADLRSDAPRNRWWVLADWHDQPDRTRGETWEGFPSRSAPLILAYGQQAGRDILSVSYGVPDSSPRGTATLMRERWHEIAVRVRWSRGADGAASVLLDGRPVASASGPNMHNAYQHYLKLGSYRHPEIVGDAWVYVAGISIVRE